jgi:general secretion pathway protein K
MGPQWFTDAGTIRTIAGTTGNPAGFSTTISALRITITVHDGQSVFRLSAVVAPLQNGATTVQTTATSQRNQASASATQGNPTQPQPSGTATASTNANAAANAKKLNYPFTLLEIRENDEIPPPPPPPPADTI